LKLPSTRLSIAAASVAGGAALAVVGVGGYALAASATTTPAKPTGVKVTATDTGSITVTWSKVSGATSYEAQAVNASTGTGGTHDNNITGTSDTISGLQPGTAYDVEVDADHGSAHSGWSAPVLAYTQASSGVVSTGSHQLVTASLGVTVNTGGSFSKRNTQVGSLQLAAGTYLLNVNATVTPDATTSGDVFPQFQVYDAQFTGSNWSDDVFNVGNGAIENPSATELSQGNLINGFLSGSTEITVPAGSETVYFYAFGYDSDQGEGSYTLNGETVTATALQTAGS